MSAWLELHTVLSLRLDATEAYRLMHNYRDEEIAKRDAMTVTWLIKKARELRAEGGKQHAAQADAVAAMASKIARGAVRPNNLRMLPADFFEPGRNYTSGSWKFRCEAISPSPGTGEPRALGWKFAPVYGVHHWHAIALDPDDWEHGGWAENTEGGEGR